MRIFVAYPSDVAAERAQIDSALQTLDPLFRQNGKTPHVDDWHRVVPDMGRAQQTIFDQLHPETAELFIMILWHRFGSPTGATDASGEPYPSGTYEEFIRVFARWRELGSPRIMVYHCTRRLPQSVDPDQLQQLRKFLKQLTNPDSPYRGFVKTFRSPKDFHATLVQDFQRLLLTNPNGAAHSQHSALRTALLDFANHLSTGKVIDSVVADTCRILLGYLDDLQTGRLSPVSTLTLYQLIRACIRHASDIMIIDHDINRWNELIMSGDHIYNTFNYSSDILSDSVNAARLHGRRYHLRRVFLLTDSDVNKTRKRTKKILATIAEHIDSVQSRIAVRVYHIASKPRPSDQHLQKGLRDVKDIVLVSASKNTVLLREHFSFDNRTRATNTLSEISTVEDDIRPARTVFEQAFKAATPLKTFLADLG